MTRPGASEFLSASLYPEAVWRQRGEARQPRAPPCFTRRSSRYCSTSWAAHHAREATRCPPGHQPAGKKPSWNAQLRTVVKGLRGPVNIRVFHFVEFPQRCTAPPATTQGTATTCFMVERCARRTAKAFNPRRQVYDDFFLFCAFVSK